MKEVIAAVKKIKNEAAGPSGVVHGMLKAACSESLPTEMTASPVQVLEEGKKNKRGGNGGR